MQLWLFRLIVISDTETVKSVADLYLEAMLGKETTYENQPTSKDRAYAAHQLARLMNHPKTYAEKVNDYTWKYFAIK